MKIKKFFSGEVIPGTIKEVSLVDQGSNALPGAKLIVHKVPKKSKLKLQWADPPSYGLASPKDEPLYLDIEGMPLSQEWVPKVNIPYEGVDWASAKAALNTAEELSLALSKKTAMKALGISDLKGGFEKLAAQAAETAHLLEYASALMKKTGKDYGIVPTLEELEKMTPTAYKPESWLIPSGAITGEKHNGITGATLVSFKTSYEGGASMKVGDKINVGLGKGGKTVTGTITEIEKDFAAQKYNVVAHIDGDDASALEAELSSSEPVGYSVKYVDANGNLSPPKPLTATKKLKPKMGTVAGSPPTQPAPKPVDPTDPYSQFVDDGEG